jgi:hypothetical protein
MTNTHDKLREAVADIVAPIRHRHANSYSLSRVKTMAIDTMIADAALSLMQPEIDRRVAEERARLLEKLWEPSEGMIEEGWKHIPANDSDGGDIRNAWQAMLAAFEQENEDGQ